MTAYEQGNGEPASADGKPVYSIEMIRDTGRMARQCSSHLPERVAQAAEATAIGTLCAKLVEKHL